MQCAPKARSRQIWFGKAGGSLCKWQNAGQLASIASGGSLCPPLIERFRNSKGPRPLAQGIPVMLQVEDYRLPVEAAFVPVVTPSLVSNLRLGRVQLGIQGNQETNPVDRTCNTRDSRYSDTTKVTSATAISGHAFKILFRDCSPSCETRERGRRYTGKQTGGRL
jgi:hypothetical protein